MFVFLSNLKRKYFVKSHTQSALVFYFFSVWFGMGADNADLLILIIPVEYTKKKKKIKTKTRNKVNVEPELIKIAT